MINNAYRYALVRVRLAAKIEKGMLEIAIEDDGSGYPPSILLGDAGEQAPLSFAGDSSGRGLYFAIVAARAHFRAGRSGRVSATNEGIHRGGRFAFVLP